MTLLPHPQAPVSRRELYTVFAGLMLALTLASLDQNIVSTALPRIVSDLGGLAHLSWVVTAFMVTSTISTPLYGKLSDIYGRKPLFFTAIIIFLVGSILCGLAQDDGPTHSFSRPSGTGRRWPHHARPNHRGRPDRAAANAENIRAFSAPSSPPAAWPGRFSGDSSRMPSHGAGSST